MSVEESIMDFLNNMVAASGDEKPILSIRLSQKATDKFRDELLKKIPYVSKGSLRFSDETTFIGIQILDPFSLGDP